MACRLLRGLEQGRTQRECKLSRLGVALPAALAQSDEDFVSAEPQVQQELMISVGQTAEVPHAQIVEMVVLHADKEVLVPEALQVQIGEKMAVHQVEKEVLVPVVHTLDTPRAHENEGRRAVLGGGACATGLLLGRS